MSDDDLLRSSLKPDLDTSRWQPPYQTNSLMLATFFGGPGVAGILFGLNYHRMRRPRLLLPCVLAGLLLCAGFVVAVRDGNARYERHREATASGGAFGGRGPRQPRIRLPGNVDVTVRNMHLFLRIAGLLAALPLAAHQKKLVGAWSATGRPTAKVFGIALALILVFSASMIGLTFMLTS